MTSSFILVNLTTNDSFRGYESFANDRDPIGTDKEWNEITLIDVLQEEGDDIVDVI